VSPGPQPARPLLLFSPDRDLLAEARRALAGFVDSGGNREVAAFDALIASTLMAIGCL